MTLVFTQPKIWAKRIHTKYTGFRTIGNDTPIIRKRDEIAAQYDALPCLCRNNKKDEMTKNAAAMVIPNFFNTVLSGLSFTILIQSELFLRFKIFFNMRLLAFIQQKTAEHQIIHLCAHETPVSVFGA